MVQRIAGLAFLGLAFLLLGAPPAIAAPGDLDQSFGAMGVMRFAWGSPGSTTILATANQPDGKVLVAGEVRATPSSPSFAVVGRVNADGSMDSAFGNGGWVGLPGAASATAIAPTGLGKVLVGVLIDMTNEPAMARLNADGSRDQLTCCDPQAYLKAYNTYERRITAIAEHTDGSMYWATSGFNVYSYEMQRSTVYRFYPQGYVDGSFGMSGRADFELAAGTEKLNAIRILADGSIIVGGWASANFYGGDILGRDAVVAKLTASGVLDPMFGTGGTVSVDFNGGADEVAALLIDSQQRVLAVGKAGYANNGSYGESAFGLLRVSAATGALDTTFGTNGKLQLVVAVDGGYPQNEESVAQAVDLAGNGDILVAGFSKPIYFYGKARGVVARVDANGQGLVPTFGQLGVLLTPYYTNDSDSYLAVTVSPGGILAVGNRVMASDSTLKLLRQRIVAANGTFDGEALASQASIPGSALTFVSAVAGNGRIAVAGAQGAKARVYGRLADGTPGAYLGYQGGGMYSGYADFQIESRVTRPRAVAFMPDDRLLVASIVGDAYETSKWAVTRFETSRGFLDYTWGSQGQVTVPAMQNGDIAAIAVQADGKVVVAGNATNGSIQAFAIARFNENGTPDTTFNGSGVLLLPAASYDDHATALALQQDGRILVAGYAQYPAQMKVVRVTAAGALDATWGSSGIALLSLGGSGTSAHAIAAQGDGKIIVGGTCFQFGVDAGLACAARLLDNGMLDPSFGNGGFATAPGPGPAFITALAVQGDGRIVAAGDRQMDDPFILRLLSDGSPDYSLRGTGFAVASATAGSWHALVEPTGRTLLTGASESGGAMEAVLVRFEGEPVDSTPNPFMFVDVTNAGVNQVMISNAVMITGITTPVAISVVGGQYSIGCTGNFRSDPGVIYGGQPVCVLHVAAGYENGTVDTTLTVGGVSDTFTSTTGALPDTTLTSSPAAATASRSATFTFSASGPGVTFVCRLDSAPVTDCSSPVSYTSLADGNHWFSVYAVNAVGADPSPAEFNWTIDATAPETSIGSGPSGTTNQASATFTFSGTDYGGNGSGLAFQCRVDGAAFAPCTSPASLTGLAHGAHVFEVRAVDPLGNIDATPASRSWTVDSIAPNTTIMSGPGSPTNAASSTFVFWSDDPAATFECEGGAGSFSACSNPLVFNNTALADGPYTIQVRARDAVGNVDPTPASWTFTLDRTAPDTTIGSSPSATTSSTVAAITFASNESGATFECRLDGAAFAPCTSPKSYSGLAEGSHGFEVRARDAAGNVDASPAAASWTIDLTAPDTTITSGPSGTAAQNAATFGFSSPDAGATFECSLDAAAFTACASGISYTGLAEGMHVFEVRARDFVGNLDTSPASRTWSVDTTNPNTTISSGPDVVTAQTGATFTFTSTETGTFLCALDGAAYTACTSPKAYTALAAGSHSFAVYGVDGAGNVDPSPAAWSWIIDAAAPDTTITSGPSGTVTQTSASFTFTATETGSTFECRLDGAAFSACVSPASLSGLSSAAHTFEVRAKDGAGNVDATPASLTWTVDTTPPDTTITASPAAATNVTSASFSFTATEAGTFECKLDAGAFAACTTPKSYTGLAVGSHTFQVRAKDAVGNTDATPATWTWTIDTTAPTTTITGGPSGPTNSTTATFTFTSSEAGTFECKLDTAAYAACTTPKTYTGLAKGNHTFTVRAKDAAGNVDASPATRTWKVN